MTSSTTGVHTASPRWRGGVRVLGRHVGHTFGQSWENVPKRGGGWAPGTGEAQNARWGAVRGVSRGTPLAQWPGVPLCEAARRRPLPPDPAPLPWCLFGGVGWLLAAAEGDGPPSCWPPLPLAGRKVSKLDAARRLGRRRRNNRQD